MTKKQLKEKNAKQRVFFDMNLGTRDMKSAKDYDRKKLKKNLKKCLTVITINDIIKIQ